MMTMDGGKMDYEKQLVLAAYLRAGEHYNLHIFCGTEKKKTSAMEEFASVLDHLRITYEKNDENNTLQNGKCSVLFLSEPDDKIRGLDFTYAIIDEEFYE